MADQFTPPPPPPPPPPAGGYDPMMGGQYVPPQAMPQYPQYPQYSAPQPGMPPPSGAGMPPSYQGAPMPGATGAGVPGSATPPPPPKPSKPANFQIGSMLPPVLKIKVPPHTLKFDEQYFLHLLAGSISLTKDEKARIIESIPKLKQSQIDELIKIFEEERKKFAELGEEHVPQLDKLVKQHNEDWVDIEMRQEQTSKADEDAKKAEEIRKQMGL